jgi:integrase/recombinase XerC
MRKESIRTPFFMIEKFETYLVTERRYSEHTVKAYIKDVESLLCQAEVTSLSELHELSHHSIRAWMVELIESGLDNRSVNRKLSSVRTFFKWARQETWVEKDPMVRVKGPRQKKRLPEFVKESEMNMTQLPAIFSSDFVGMRDQLILEMFYQTGMRLSELIGIKESDVQNQSVKVLGKRNKERIIPISKELDVSIRVYQDAKHRSGFTLPYLFVTDKGNILYPKFVYRKINYYLSLVTNLNKRSPHVLRHTFATHMLNNGAGLESLKEILGHADLSATQVYTHNSFDKLTRIYKQAHPRGHKSDEYGY